MPVHSPRRVLLHGIPLAFVAKHVGGHGRKPVDVDLALVPIIDLMICLVVFLLMSFNASGQLVAQPTIVMPQALHGEALQEAPTISVDSSVVMLDGRRIADTHTLASDARIERIEGLIQDLDTLKRNWLVLHPNRDFPGEIVLEADVSIDYRVIKKLMFSAGQAGYPNLRLAVNHIGEP
jgi:biopolymer transport protein ExbD